MGKRYALGAGAGILGVVFGNIADYLGVSVTLAVLFTVVVIFFVTYVATSLQK